MSSVHLSIDRVTQREVKSGCLYRVTVRESLSHNDSDPEYRRTKGVIQWASCLHDGNLNEAMRVPHSPISSGPQMRQVAATYCWVYQKVQPSLGSTFMEL